MNFRPIISPRIVGIVTIVCLLAWIAGPLVQLVLIGSGATPLGARLSIGETRVSLLSSELEFTGVTLADASHPEQKLLACQRVSVDVEGIPLLRRKFVVRNATATGVRLLPAPLSAAEMSARWPLPQHWKAHLPAQNVFHTSLAEALASAADASRAETPAAALLDVLAASWPRQLFELQNDLGVYELRVERLAEIADELARASSSREEVAGRQPVRQTWREIRELEEGVLAFKERADAMRKAFSKDRQRLLSMKQAEIEQSHGTAPWQTPSPQVLTDYFLGAAASDRSWEILRFVQWARAYLPTGQESSATAKSAGLTIAYPERNPLPEFVLRALHFEGTGCVADESFRFAGTLQNLTNDPRRFSQPTRLVVDAKVPHRVVVEALLDCRANVPCNRIVVRCPSWSLPAQMLGSTSQVAVAVQPSVLSLRAELTLIGDNISGVVQMRQQQLALTPKVAGELGGERIQAALAEMLAQIETIDYQVQFNGPIDSPAMTLTSPWGDKVVGGLQHAFEQELALRASRRAEQIAHALDDRFAQWEDAALADQARLQARLATTLEQVRMLDGLVQRHLPPDAESRGETTVRSNPAGTNSRK